MDETREEQFLSGIADGTAVELTPITRREHFLAKIAGQDVEIPDPITREEMLLKKIAENGGGMAKLVFITAERNGDYYPKDHNNADGFSRVKVQTPEWWVQVTLFAASISSPLTVAAIFPPDRSPLHQTLVEFINSRPWMLTDPNRCIGELSFKVAVPGAGSTTLVVAVRISPASDSSPIDGVILRGGAYDNEDNYLSVQFGVDDEHNGCLYFVGGTGKMSGMTLDSATMGALIQGATEISLTIPARLIATT